MELLRIIIMNRSKVKFRSLKYLLLEIPQLEKQLSSTNTSALNTIEHTLQHLVSKTNT